MLSYVMLCYATPDKLHLFTRTPKYTTFIYKETSKEQRFQFGRKGAESGERRKNCSKVVAHLLDGEVPYRKTCTNRTNHKVVFLLVFGFFLFKSHGNLGKEWGQSPEVEEERCSLRTSIMINVGWQPGEFKFSSEPSRLEIGVDDRSCRSAVGLI